MLEKFTKAKSRLKFWTRSGETGLALELVAPGVTIFVDAHTPHEWAEVAEKKNPIPKEEQSPPPLGASGGAHPSSNSGEAKSPYLTGLTCFHHHSRSPRPAMTVVYWQVQLGTPISLVPDVAAPPAPA